MDIVSPLKGMAGEGTDCAVGCAVLCGKVEFIQLMQLMRDRPASFPLRDLTQLDVS